MRKRTRVFFITHILAATFLWGTIIISYVTEMLYPRDAVHMFSTQCGGCEELQQRPRCVVSHHATVVLSDATDSKPASFWASSSPSSHQV